jgi:hypothetical protein
VLANRTDRTFSNGVSERCYDRRSMSKPKLLFKNISSVAAVIFRHGVEFIVKI